MKKLILNLCTLLACCGASASDTWVVNSDGDTIWYDFDYYALTASVTFKGKTYKVKTNSKGIAKLTIKGKVLKKLKIGKKITYKASYLKDTRKRVVKVKR